MWCKYVVSAMQLKKRLIFIVLMHTLICDFSDAKFILLHLLSDFKRFTTLFKYCKSSRKERENEIDSRCSDVVLISEEKDRDMYNCFRRLTIHFIMFYYIYSPTLRN